MPKVTAVLWLIALVIHQANDLLMNYAGLLNLVTDWSPVLERPVA
jgi:hypothetical protein